MPEKIHVLNYSSIREVLLKVIADEFSRLRKDSSFETERSRFLYPSIPAIEYLKETNQFRRQFQLCLKNFDGRTAETFRKEYVDAVQLVYEDYVVSLGQNVIKFAENNVKSKKRLDLDFKNVRITNLHFIDLLEDYFSYYGEEVLGMKDHPWTCRIARIHDSSKATMNRLEGKLRIIGQYGCLDQVIRFIQLRIGLYGKYTYKILVDNLDELIDDFLIDSTNNQINQVKAKQPIDKLVKEAANRYEILNAPKYLVNRQAYKSVLRKRINTLIKKD